ncbi:MAG: metallophosphoesterase [Clostridiales bacterium]|nr:metallophosphoesterase [Clostridiales bacterium]MCF8023785.1 metallophosphoesterase [Clostridiales bacterium]
MRVLVLSDTHGDLKNALYALQKEQYDIILHAGDFVRDAGELAAQVKVPLYKVLGNCDVYDLGVEKQIIELEGKKILLIHGHQLKVKTTYQRLLYCAAEENADAVVFGHTHEPLNIEQDGILLFNPGSTSRPKHGQQSSYGIMEIKGDKIKGDIYYFKRKNL